MENGGIKDLLDELEISISRHTLHSGLLKRGIQPMIVNWERPRRRILIQASKVKSSKCIACHFLLVTRSLQQPLQKGGKGKTIPLPLPCTCHKSKSQGKIISHFTYPPHKVCK